LIIGAIWLALGFAFTQMLANAIEQSRPAPTAELWQPPNGATDRAREDVRD
jgi:hypothetical protein